MIEYIQTLVPDILIKLKYDSMFPALNEELKVWIEENKMPDYRNFINSFNFHSAELLKVS